MKRFLLLPLLCGFHQPATFEASAADGGGNRMFFDGSPRQKAYDCSACHDGGAHAITARVDGLGGTYVPGTTYTIQVTLAGEHAGFGTANNQNGFVAEVVDDGHVAIGTLATPDVDRVELVDDGSVAAGEGKGTTMWTFTWTAPAAGRGAATLYLGLVDGDGANSVQVPQNDPGGDDVATARVRMCEGEPGCAEPSKPALTESKAAGCNASGGTSPLLASIVISALIGLVRRRRAALLAITLAGCFEASGPQDCPDHVCGNGTTDGGSSCRENWTCTAWQATPGSDQAGRTCTDQNNAGTTECKPATSATLPALDLAYFQCRVSPIFQRGCGQLACHGTETEHPFRLYTRGRLRNKQMVFPVNTCGENPNVKVDLDMRGTGTVMCEGWSKHTPEEWQKNFDSSRSFMLDVTNPDDSLILREAAKGGLPHAQVKLFAAGDPDYQTIRNWLGGATLGSTCNTGAN